MKTMQESPDQTKQPPVDAAATLATGARWRAAEDHYRMLFNAIDQGFCIVEVLFDDHETPLDYRFLETNAAFERQTGIVNAVGRRMRDVAPLHEQHWFDIYGRIALTGEPARLEQHAAQLNRWYDVYAFRIGNPHERTVAILFNDITARKRAEEALRASEEKFRAIVDQTSVGICHADLSGTLMFANHTFCTMLGYDQADVVGTTIWDLTYADDRAENRGLFDQLRTTGVPFEFEKRLVRKDQSLLWVHVSVAAIHDSEGHPHATVAVVLDISARKRVEEQLHASEARLHQALAIATVGVIFFTIDGQITDANDAFLQLSGYSHADLAHGRVRWDTMTPPEWMPPSLHALEELRTHGSSTPYEKEYLRKDGTRWWALFAARLLTDDEGVEFIIDITARKAAEAALRASEERLRIVLESVQDYAIFTLDPEGRVTSWNTGAHRLKGYTAEEILGQPMELFYTVEDVVAGKPTHERATALRVGRSEDESWRVRKDGSRMWVNEIMTSLCAEDGTHLGFTKISRDLTARKQAEDAVARALADAEAARAEAEAALQTRDQFLSIASHELRTPLTVLRGYASLLPRAIARGTDKAEQLTAGIVRQTQRLNGLIDQLLDTSRLQSGLFVLERRTLDLAALTTEVVGEVRATLPPNSSHTLELVHPPEPVLVDGDAERLHQVLYNLLSNAIKYSPQGGTIRVRVDHSATEAVVEVTDQGIGIPAAAQARLFEPFYRAPNVGTQLSGFGLGLHIVKEIVARHGGRIEVTSTEGAGATFRVVLPLHISAQAATSKPASSP